MAGWMHATMVRASQFSIYFVEADEERRPQEAPGNAASLSPLATNLEKSATET